MTFIATTGSPALVEVREAGIALFEARAAEATELGRPPRAWPPTIAAYGHWVSDYLRAAASGGIELPLDAAVAEVNAWVTAIANSR